MFLFGSNLIDQPTYTRMFNVKGKRDDLAHNPFESLKIDPGQAERLIKDGIKCLKYLGVADLPMN